jgi:hypothetical protein
MRSKNAYPSCPVQKAVPLETTDPYSHDKAPTMKNLVAVVMFLLSTSLFALEVDKATNKETKIESKRVNDSIKDWIGKAEDQKFQRDKKKITANIKKYLDASRTSTEVKYKIDSISLDDFDYNDTLPEYWKHVDWHDYIIWAELNDKFAIKVHIYTTKDNIDSTSFDKEAYKNDDWVKTSSLALITKREIKAGKYFEANRAAITGIIKKGLQEYANDPSSIRIAKVIFNTINSDDETLYRVAYRGRNGFGAITLSVIDVKLDSKNKFIGTEDVDTKSDDSE